MSARIAVPTSTAVSAVSATSLLDEPGRTIHRQYGLPTESALKMGECATCGFPGLETAFQFAGDSEFRFRACEVCRLNWQRSGLSGYEFVLQRQAERDAIAPNPAPVMGRQSVMGRQHGCSIGNLLREFVDDPDSEDDDEDWAGHWPSESPATILLGRWTERGIILVFFLMPSLFTLALTKPGTTHDVGGVSLFLMGCLATFLICRMREKNIASTTVILEKESDS